MFTPVLVEPVADEPQCDVSRIVSAPIPLRLWAFRCGSPASPPFNPPAALRH